MGASHQAVLENSRVTHCGSSEQDWQQKIFEHNRSYYDDGLTETTTGTLGAKVRLLEVQPGTLQDPIVSILTTERLHDGLTYDALSYSWGKKVNHSVHTITLNGKDGFQVTYNAFRALRQIRDEKQPRTIWIDAICIDQTNATEKSQQVQQMNTIYKLASSVLCFLGNCGSGPEIGTACTDHQVCLNKWDEKEIVCRQSPLLDVGGDDEHSEKWWSRIWTVQECCLAKEVKILIGPHVYEFTTFYMTLRDHHFDEENEELLWPRHVTAACSDLATRRNIMASQKADYDCRYRTGFLPGKLRMGLYDYLESTTMLRATDPRDKVYGLAGMCADVIEVDYNRSLIEVCIQAVNTIFEAEGHMEILIQFWPSFGLETCSWLPNFSEPPSNITQRHGSWNWEGEYEPCPGSVEYSIQDRRLIVSGVRLDRIVLVVSGCEVNGQYEHAFDGLDVPGDWPSKDAMWHLETAILKFVREADLPSPYLDLQHAFRKTIEYGMRTVMESFWEGGLEGIDELTLEDLDNPKYQLLHTRFFITSSGYFGIGHTTDIRLGDEVAMLHNLSWPLLIRPSSSGFFLLTKTYVHGVMKGEMKDCWRDGQYRLEEITLK